MGEVAIRFALGGLIISLFALLGEVFRPKTFAGIFGAAPSVALVSLALAFASHGRAYAATAGRTMALGAVGLVVYSIASRFLIQCRSVPVWLGAGVCWSVWLLTAVGLWWAIGSVRT